MAIIITIIIINHCSIRPHNTEHVWWWNKSQLQKVRQAVKKQRCADVSSRLYRWRRQFSWEAEQSGWQANLLQFVMRLRWTVLCVWLGCTFAARNAPGTERQVVQRANISVFLSLPRASSSAILLKRASIGRPCTCAGYRWSWFREL